MEYHEIGERFEYDGVVLEVIGLTGCTSCFFNEYGECKLKDNPKYCGIDTRNDKRSISYKFVEKYKPKEMEQCKPNDIAKAIVGSFKETIEDNKRMKDALLVFSQYLQGNFSQSILLDCNDEEVNELINIVGSGIRKLKQESNGKSE